MSSLDFQSSTAIIQNIGEDIDLNNGTTTLTDAFRHLRNTCATNPKCQDELEENLIQNAHRVLLRIVCEENVSEECVICLRVGLQFLANFIVNNKKNQEVVWLKCQDLLDKCLRYNDTKVQNCCAMMLYNIFLGYQEYMNELRHPFEDLFQLTLKENTSEFAVFTLELLILKSDYVEKFYNCLKPESRLIILEIIKNLITGQHNASIRGEIIKFYVSQFTEKSDCILKTTEKYADSLDPIETVKILELLVAFSSNDQQCYLEIIQKETSLLINAIMLLKNTHSLSKQKGNDFSMLTKLSEYNMLEENTSIQENPVFGFKCLLIRLIGNMCWKNSENQNQVRELECVEVLLDCCNIDARNPFIIQWCILAIRNICEKNIENQKVIASMSKEGKVDAARLQEIGIMLNAGADGDALCIAPMETKK